MKLYGFLIGAAAPQAVLFLEYLSGLLCHTGSHSHSQPEQTGCDTASRRRKHTNTRLITVKVGALDGS